MAYIIKSVSEAAIDTGRYELFATSTVTDVEGNEVQIPQSIGIFTLAQLEVEKAQHEARITEIQLKIDAIGEEATVSKT